VARTGLVIAFVGLLLLPGTATAQDTVESSLVRGRARVEFGTDRAGPLIMATVYGAQPGSRITLACEGRCGMAPVSREIPSSGVTVLRARPGRRVSVGDRISSTMTDPQGRSRTTQFQARRASLPVMDRSCFDPAGNEVDCVVDCVRGARVPPEDPCRGAGRRVRVPDTSVKWYAKWNRRGTRFPRMRVKRLPAGVQVILICKTRGVRGCGYLFARSLPLRGGTVNVVPYLRGVRFRPGVWFELHFLKASQTAAVLRWVIRNNRKPQIQQLCEAPHRFETHPCSGG
jgi:hypothetical protein